MEDITDADYAHAKRVCKDFKIQNLDDYLDLYVQNDTLLLADVFEKIRNMCLEIYELDPAHFLSVPAIIQKIFQKNSSFHVTKGTTRKVQFLFVRRYLLVLPEFSFRVED